jgi:hypothetical protein
MMTSSRFWKFSLLVCCLGVSSLASTQENGFRAYGPTETSCGTYVQALPGSADEQRIEWWFMGFVSGASRELKLRGVDLTRTDVGGMKTWLLKYCRDNPLHPVTTAAMSLVDELKPR